MNAFRFEWSWQALGSLLALGLALAPAPVRSAGGSTENGRPEKGGHEFALEYKQLAFELLSQVTYHQEVFQYAFKVSLDDLAQVVSQVQPEARETLPGSCQVARPESPRIIEHCEGEPHFRTVIRSRLWGKQVLAEKRKLVIASLLEWARVSDPAGKTTEDILKEFFGWKQGIQAPEDADRCKAAGPDALEAEVERFRKIGLRIQSKLGVSSGLTSREIAEYGRLLSPQVTEIRMTHERLYPVGESLEERYERTAVNAGRSEPYLIRVNYCRWINLHPVVRAQLVLHEFLPIIGKDDSRYDLTLRVFSRFWHPRRGYSDLLGEFNK